MKGLNIKKLAAVAVGSALVGSALAPMVAAAIVNNADQITKADLVNTSTGAPLVQVAVGTNGAAISDFVWAGNIAAKVAQMATAEKNVTLTSGDGETSDPTISDKTVDLSVGGTVSYSSESSYLMQDSNYPMKSDGASANEFIKAVGNGQLGFLTNSTKSYTYNGSSYSVLMKEEVVINADAKFDKTTPIKDMGLYIDSSGFKYVMTFGDGTKNGLPATTSATDVTAFQDGDTDNVVIPMFGENYTVNKIDRTASPYNMRLIKESDKTNYYEGNEITGLSGKGAYEGQELKVKVGAITASGPAASTYSARFELYDSEGNLVDTQTASSGSFLDEIFTYGGEYVLDTLIYVPTIAVESSTGKGYVTATVGKGVIRIYDNSQFPYDSSDTNSDNDYWVANLDFNSTGSTTPTNVWTLIKITIKNSVKKWNNAARSNPLYPGTQALFESHQGEDMQTAKFLEGVGLGESDLGYNYVRLKFDGFKMDKTMVTYEVGKTTGCDTYSANTGCVRYRDAGNINRTIPFYVEITGINDTTWQSFKIDQATFWYRCSTTDTNIGTVADMNAAGMDSNILYINGFATTWIDKSGDFNVTTDFGMVGASGDTSGDNLVGRNIDLNGVSYLGTGNWFSTHERIGLLADGNCQFSSTDPNTTPTYIGGGDGTPIANSIYYQDSNGAAIGKASYPLQFTGGSTNLTDTYNYGFTANETYNKLYLVLDKSTNFTSPYSNFDVSFLGTNLTEDGAVIIQDAENSQANTAGTGIVSSSSNNHRTHYVPDVAAMGGNQANQYYVAAFGIDANSDSGDDLNINIETRTGKPVSFPNDQLSSWNSDVNTVGGLWTLTTDTTSDTFLQQAYLDYGTKVTLTTDKVTVYGPETDVYLKLALLGKASSTTIAGGEALTGLGEGETGTTDSGTEITISSIDVTATCPAGGGAVANPATYMNIYPVGEMVVTDTVAPAKAVIVGGYLVNKLARNVVLSDGTELTEALTASGDRVVDVLSSGHIVVAGYTANDTKEAAQDLIDALDALM